MYVHWKIFTFKLTYHIQQYWTSMFLPHRKLILVLQSVVTVNHLHSQSLTGLWTSGSTFGQQRSGVSLSRSTASSIEAKPAFKYPPTPIWSGFDFFLSFHIWFILVTVHFFSYSPLTRTLVIKDAAGQTRFSCEMASNSLIFQLYFFFDLFVFPSLKDHCCFYVLQFSCWLVFCLRFQCTIWPLLDFNQTQTAHPLIQLTMWSQNLHSAH